MLDPAKVYAEDPDKRDTLRLVWPDLHQALDRHVNGVIRVPVCAIVGHAAPGPEARGRLTLNGTPACEQHLAASDRPGGYPLPLVDPRTWSANR
jgi:hypothetical protein